MATFVLRNPDIVRALWSHVQGSWRDSSPPLEVKVAPQKQTRSSEQNARMWAMLDEVSRQVDWYGNRLTADEWKDLFTASLKKQRAVPGIDGGFVVLGTRTSKMTVAEMGELMTLMEAFGAEHNVTFAND